MEYIAVRDIEELGSGVDGIVALAQPFFILWHFVKVHVEIPYNSTVRSYFDKLSGQKDTNIMHCNNIWRNVIWGCRRYSGYTTLDGRSNGAMVLYRVVASSSIGVDNIKKKIMMKMKIGHGRHIYMMIMTKQQNHKEEALKYNLMW